MKKILKSSVWIFLILCLLIPNVNINIHAAEDWEIEGSLGKGSSGGTSHSSDFYGIAGGYSWETLVKLTEPPTVKNDKNEPISVGWAPGYIVAWTQGDAAKFNYITPSTPLISSFVWVMESEGKIKKVNDIYQIRNSEMIIPLDIDFDKSYLNIPKVSSIYNNTHYIIMQGYKSHNYLGYMPPNKHFITDWCGIGCVLLPLYDDY